MLSILCSIRKMFPAAAALLLLVVCSLLSFTSTSVRAADQFPYYSFLKTNVEFWEKIYSTYSVNSAVIHDRDDLSKIYEVIDLLDKQLPAADRVNQAVIRFTLEKYQTILQDLAGGKRPQSAEEKKVAAMFKGSQANRRMAMAVETLRSQTGQKERFYEGVIRSGGYIDAFRRIFHSYGLPIELAYLPHVESSFNVKAYSKAGASGAWQFTQGTGKQYLEINDAIDERSDPFIAADAAARYLHDSYQKLGNWPMALTAYNYGTAGMVRAQNAMGSYQKIFTSYREGHFGFATQNFYSEFLAALHVARKLEKAPGVQLNRPVQFTAFSLPGYIHIDKIRSHFRISDDELKRLNPAIRPAVFSGKQLLPRGYPLRLPAQKNISAAIASLPKSFFSSKQKRDKYYKVKSGDSLGRIAIQHGVSLSALMAANGLKRDSKIFVGQQLLIPTRSASSSITTPAPLFATVDTKQRSAPQSMQKRPSQSLQPVQLLAAENYKIQRSPTQ